MNTARIGDKIRSHGIEVTIGKLYYSDCYDGVWDIEFIDTNGQYRHWKQQYDGGEYIRVPEDESDIFTEHFKDQYGRTATIEHIDEYLNDTCYFDVRLTVRTINGNIIHKRKYRTRQGASIAMGRVGDNWYWEGNTGKVKIKL